MSCELSPESVHEEIFEDVVESVKRVVPKKSDLKELARFFNIDIDEYPANKHADVLKVLSRMYVLLKYSSLITSLRNDIAVIGGAAVGVLLAQKGEKPRFTVDVDMVAGQSEAELASTVGEVNTVLERLKLVVRIPAEYGDFIDVGRMRVLQPEEKLGRRIVPLLFNAFIYGEGKHFENFVATAAEKEGKKVDMELVRELSRRLRKLGDVRVDGLKIAVTVGTPPTNPLNIEIPGIGILRVNSPTELIRAKLDILRTPLNWDSAPASVKINWAVDIVKSVLDLRLLRYYGVDLNLTDADRVNIVRNIEETQKIFDQVAGTTTIRRTVFVEEPFDELVSEIIRRIA